MIPRLAPAGDDALLVVFGDVLDDAANARVLALDRAVAAAELPGVVETIPAYAALGVAFDPLAVDAGALGARLLELAGTTVRADDAAGPAAAAARELRTVTIPVRYGGDDGPDLADVARHAGLDVDAVVARHAGATYRCSMLGFTPGFPYLAGLDPALACPRLDTPRGVVPAGSVALADAQAGVYPFASPGGWRLLGRTPLALFDAARAEPALVRPGDRVRFEPLDAAASADGAGLAAPLPCGARSMDARDATLRVETPGLLTLVQDLGRPGFARLGLPPSGALDPFSLAAGNLLAGNAPGAAALEIHDVGPALAAARDTLVVVAGADLGARIDGTRVPRWTPLALRGGSRVNFDGWQRGGHRAYLCVAGGIDVPLALGARATYLRIALGGLGGRALRRGDALATGTPLRRVIAGRSAPAHLVPDDDGDRPLGVHPGPQAGRLAPHGAATFFATRWTISRRSDRMGFRLDGPPLELAGPAGVLSQPVPAGALQVAGDGLPIALLADRQTTGGYAIPFVVAAADVRALAQRGAGDAVRFAAVDRATARAALFAQRARLAALAAHVEGR